MWEYSSGKWLQTCSVLPVAPFEKKRLAPVERHWQHEQDSSKSMAGRMHTKLSNGY
jgi:hypothetical protein